QPYRQTLTRRNVNFVSRSHSRTGVIDLPPELVTGYHQVGRRRRRRITAIHRAKRDDEKEDDDQKWNDRPRDLYLPVTENLPRVRFTWARTKTKNRVGDCAGNDHENQREDDG